MNTTTMLTQAVDHQKNLFNNAFTIMTSLQDQGQMVMDLAFEKTPVPDTGKKFGSYWVGLTKQGQVNYKKYVDSTFDKVKELFAGPEPVSAPAPEPVSAPIPIKTSKKSEK